MAHNPLAADWAVLRNYVSFLNPQKSVVIIPLCPFGALAGSYEAMDDRYYSILYPSTIPSYSFSRDLQIQEKYKHPVRHYPFYALFLDLFKLIVKRKFKVLSEVEMENDSHRWIDSWKLEFSIKDLRNLCLWLIKMVFLMPHLFLIKLFVFAKNIMVCQ